MAESIANIEVDENKFNSTNHTENLSLPQFIATDKPGWLTDFNGAMEVIDEAAGVLQDQITEQFEDLESVHTQLDRVDADVNDPETGVRQVLHDTQTRVTDLETTVGDESHGLVKDVHDLQEDMIQTNTMAVKSNAQLGSIINLLCNKYSQSAQYSQGAYVYTENDDGSLNFLRCTATTHGAFNPDKWEDVTEKLISALDNSGGGGGSQYVLPVAGDADDPDAVLGGVIIGEGLSIDPETGILSRTVTPTEGIGPDYYASSVRAGLVRPNTEAGLYVNSSNGLLSIVLDDNTMEFTNDGKLRAKADTSRFAQGQGILISNENVPTISVRLAENSNLGFDGNGGLKAILPSSAYEIVQGEGITITTDSQTNEKTVSLVQASTNTLGGVRPKSDSFAFESYDPNDQSKKKMTIQLKEKGGLQKQDGVGLSVKVDNDTVTIDPVTGELKANNGGGGGGYTLPIASSSTLGGIKVGSGLTIDPNTGVLDADGSANVDVDNKSIGYNEDLELEVKSNAKKLSHSYLGDLTGTTSEMVYGLPGLARLDNPSTVGYYIADASKWNEYEGCTFTFTVKSIQGVNSDKSTYPDAGNGGIPLFVADRNDNYVRVATLVQGVSYRIGRYTKNQWSSGGIGDPYKTNIKNLISPNKYDDMEKIVTLDVPQIMSDVQTQINAGVSEVKATAAEVAHLHRKANPNNVTYTGNRWLPIPNILQTGDIEPGNIMPIASTVVGETPFILLPRESGATAEDPKVVKHPYAILYPLSVKINTPDANTPSGWSLVNADFTGKYCTLVYTVETVWPNPFAQDAYLPLNTICQKRIPIDKDTLSGKSGGTVVTILDKQAKTYDGSTTGDYGHKYGIALVYPQDGIALRISAQLEVFDLTTGDVKRYFSTVISSSSVDEPVPSFDLYGATYLYDLATEEFVDSDIYSGQ